MLDAIVKLTEKIVELSKYRNERKQRRFEDLVDPIYAEMIKVHQAYLSMFTTALEQLEAGLSIEDIIAPLSRARLADEAKRHALIAQVEVFHGRSDMAYANAFLTHVREYFGESPFSHNNSPSNMLVVTLMSLESKVLHPELLLVRGNPRESVARTVSMTIDQLRSNWNTLARGYAVLRANSLP